MPRGIYNRKMSKPRPKHTKESKQKIQNALIGHPIYKSEKRSENISKATKGRKAWNAGKSYKPLEKHWNWQGGKSFEPYTIDWSKTLKRSIRERDKYICRICNVQQTEKAHDVHHIDYDKTNCNPKNLITLCRKCHIKTNYNRKKWIEFFVNYV